MIYNAGIGTVIGVDYTTSSLPGAINQRNVFAPTNYSIIITVTASNTIISGNYFGYLITGAPYNTPKSYYGSGIRDNGSPMVIIGTNEDGVGDELERNWFGCLYESLISNAGTSQISGNYFGFGTVNQTSPASLVPAFCPTAANMVFVTGDVILGNTLHFVLDYYVWTIDFLTYSHRKLKQLRWIILSRKQPFYW